MSLSNGDQSAQLKRALTALRELRTRLDQVERAQTEPIAIIGMGCRVPGADSTERFWDLLRNGDDAIRETPVDRWDSDALYHPDPLSPGKVATRWGGFLDAIDRFDAAFFGIAPREAEQMDPQQRILLEVTYEALEAAGQPLERLAGSRSGVFIGVHGHSNDYYMLQSADTEAIDVYSGTGTSHSVIAGRLSYILDLHGPCLSVDTACSSSLVAVHLAVQSLRREESDLAIAGGVNVILEPTFTIAASRMQMLAADGRCKPFDASADGFVRSEGCGVLVLKRLRDALVDGDPIQAVIYGSAINQDGHSNGLTAPNGISQQLVIRAALRDAGVGPDRISYVEAHGTGTPLGDPIEVEALRGVLDESAAEAPPCLLGSVKANIGHLEGAAGVTGLIKTVLSLQYSIVPRLPHFQALNPFITLDGSRMVIPVEATPWLRGETPRYAGVSSFGWSGTNAHVILGDAPLEAASTESDIVRPTSYLLPLSARSEPALRALAAAYAERMGDADAGTVADITHTAATCRSQLAERLAVVAPSRQSLIERLESFVAGRSAPGLARATAGERAPRIVFVFPGQGGQWLGMGRQLAQSQPVFADALARCSAAIQAETGWSLLDEIRATPEQSRLAMISVVQPAIFAIQVALAALLEDWGVRPDVVVGHSMGEVAAAYVAGILSLEDAAAVICRRSQLLTRVAGRGGMGVVELSLTDAEALVERFDGRLAVAASNGPATTVLAGDSEDLDQALEAVQGRGLFARRVQVDVASHSPQVDSLLDDLEATLQDITPRNGNVTFASTVTGRPLSGDALDVGYWVRNLRQPVLFGPVVDDLLREAETVFLELSPHPVLSGAIDGAARALQVHATIAGAMRREQDEEETLREAVGSFWAAGVTLNWERICPGRRVLPLPPYPWQRDRFWISGTQKPAQRRSTAANDGQPADPLLGTEMPALAHLPGSRFWQGSIDPGVVTTTVAGASIATGSRAALMAGKAAAAAGMEVAKLEIHDQPLLLGTLETQTVYSPQASDALVQVFTRSAADTAWRLWATAHTVGATEASSESPDSVQLRLSRQTPSPGLAGLWSGANEVLSRIDIEGDDVLDQLARVDVAIATLLSMLDSERSLIADVVSVSVIGDVQKATWIHARRQPDQGGTLDIYVFDRDGAPVATLTGITLQQAGDEFQRKAAIARVDGSFYATTWVAYEDTGLTAPPDGEWLILADDDGLADRLAAHLEQAGSVARILRIDRRDSDAADQLLAASLRDGSAGIVDVRWVSEIDLDLPAAVEHIVGAALVTAQTVAQAPLLNPPRIWFVTRGAQPVDGAPANSAAAAVWGVGRVIDSEYPQMWGGVVDLDAIPGEREAELLGRTLLSAGEREMAVRGDQRYVGRLVQADVPSSPLSLAADATYLLTGGAGGVGLAIANWMVAAGARHLVLIGRRPLAHAAEEAVAELEAAGARVTYLQGDVAETADVQRIMAAIADGMPPLRGIVHAAGVLADAALLQQTPAGVHAVVAPKVTGAWNLVNATRDLPLDFVALFSSVSALLGVPGQSNYAAANAVLDALAAELRAGGVPAMSIGWGRWGEAGLATTSERSSSLDRLGFTAMPSVAGAAAFGRILAGDAAQIAVVDIDWPVFLSGRVSIPSLLRELDPVAGQVPDTVPAGLDMRSVLEQADPDNRFDLLLEHVRGLAAVVMRFDDPARIPPGQGFFQIGMDSLTAIDLKNRLQQSLGLTLPATTAFDYPTAVTLTRHLLGLLIPDPAAGVFQDDSEDVLDGFADLSRDELRELLDVELQLIDEELVR